MRGGDGAKPAARRRTLGCHYFAHLRREQREACASGCHGVDSPALQFASPCHGGDSPALQCVSPSFSTAVCVLFTAVPITKLFAVDLHFITKLFACVGLMKCKNPARNGFRYEKVGPRLAHSSHRPPARRPRQQQAETSHKRPERTPGRLRRDATSPPQHDCIEAVR